MKIKSKILISILIALVILTMNGIVLISSVKAASLIDISHIDLHYGGDCGQLLKYKNVIVKTTYVEYTYKGNNYPAYCLNKTLDGVTDESSYAVTASYAINDIGLWRTVINGYPYKSIEELGVVDREEAFTATKHAIYCYLFENTPDDYEAIGDGGERTLSALKKIVSDAETSTEVPGANETKIINETEEWQEDEIDSKYVSKTYSFSSSSKHKEYDVAIEGDIPEGTKITDIEGNETRTFTMDEKFKVMIRKDKLNKDGAFKLKVQAEIKTKPVIYGASPDANLQNYALTGYMYEDSITNYEDSYKKIEQPEEPVIKQTIVKEETKEEVKILPVTGM